MCHERKWYRGILRALTLSALFGLSAIPIPSLSATTTESNTLRAADDSARSGVHDFDFLFGRWRVHHRRLSKRLRHSEDWQEFQGTLVSRPVLAGSGNVDDNLINQPGTSYRALAIRAFDEKTGQWSIWWLDGRTPSAWLAPPVRGAFKDGVGRFYAEDTLDGRAILVRYVWSEITSKSCRWEQAFSADHGRTWELNWIMNLSRME